MNSAPAKCIVMAAAGEALLTGVVMIVWPSLFCELILGTELPASGTALAPIAGIAMLGTGLLGWPAPKGSNEQARPLRALMAYNVLATVYLAYLRVSGLFDGVLLAPAIALHAVLSVLLGWAWHGSTHARRS